MWVFQLLLWVQLPVTRIRADIIPSYDCTCLTFDQGALKEQLKLWKSYTLFLQLCIWGNKLLLLHRLSKHIFWCILRFLDINLHPSFKLTRGYCCWEWKETSLWAFFVDFYFLQKSQLYKSFKAVSLNKITLLIFYDFILSGWSDHCVSLSVTNWLTNSCSVDLTDVAVMLFKMPTQNSLMFVVLQMLIQYPNFRVKIAHFRP